MFEFAWWWAWFALPLPLFMLFLPARKTQQDVALKVPSLQPDTAISSPPVSKKRGITVIAFLAWICLVAAAARPQWLGEPVSVADESREMMLAVDLSGSMKIDDMQINGRPVNRLTMIKSVLHDFIKRREGDRLGLILFADTAYLQAPLTFDRDTVATLLNEAVIGLVGEQTAIGDALGLAVKRFEAKENGNKVVILLTDGQNTAGNITPQQAKELAVNRGATVYTIGVGADSMLVQSFFGNRQVNPSQELDEEMLTDLATSTGGKYFRARDAAELEAIYQRLDELQPIKGEDRKMRPQSALFYYPLAAALILTCLPILMYLLRNLRSRWSLSQSQQKMDTA
ncbi:VWA domain-containing protein [Alteromonas aestuariivivens]|uniref:VWA domain-containing protein n=1 Tax=Alteromonas aestuariivivens TaxID=1938339 RepID=A0A3D8M7Q8_9ALTE|nr:VWA domain-containing protein [Alteromonas aestuariivivens]RDV25202.1 VWA domain-containing protein [Alteromonas aestuariivivens]